MERPKERIRVYQEREAGRYKNVKAIILEKEGWAFTSLAQLFLRRKYGGFTNEVVLFSAWVTDWQRPPVRVTGMLDQVKVPKGTFFEPFNLSPGSRGELELFEDLLSGEA